MSVAHYTRKLLPEKMIDCWVLHTLARVKSRVNPIRGKLLVSGAGRRQYETTLRRLSS